LLNLKNLSVIFSLCTSYPVQIIVIVTWVIPLVMVHIVLLMKIVMALLRAPIVIWYKFRVVPLWLDMVHLI